MTKTEMLETMKRLDAHANALLLIGASDIDLLGGESDASEGGCLSQRERERWALKQLIQALLKVGVGFHRPESLCNRG